MGMEAGLQVRYMLFRNCSVLGALANLIFWKCQGLSKERLN